MCVCVREREFVCKCVGVSSMHILCVCICAHPNLTCDHPQERLQEFAGLTEEYLDKMIELGYIMLFSAACPLLASISLVCVCVCSRARASTCACVFSVTGET